MLQVGDLGSRPVAGEHDLFMSIKKCIERMEKFFLRTLLASEKLDVIDQKKVGLTISLSELD